MSFFAPELMVQTALQNAVSDLVANYATSGMDVYGFLPTSPFDFQTDAQNFWQTNSASLLIQQGLAWQEIQAPQLAILPQGSDEAQQYIGQVVGIDLDANGNYTGEQHGTEFSSQIDIHCLAVNANLVAYLVLFAKWALTNQRAALTQAGLMEQRISVGALLNLEEQLKESVPVFARILTLSCTHYDTYNEVGIVPSSTSVNATAN